MSGEPLSILVVEDEDMVREIVTLELRDAGFRVVEARDGQAAIDMLAAGEAVDLLFTDIRLPGAMDGWTVAEQARRLHADLPVIYATGFAGDDPRLVTGARFFKKPYAPAAIVDAINELKPGRDRD